MADTRNKLGRGNEIAERPQEFESEGASDIEIEDALSERLSLYTSNTEFLKSNYLITYLKVESPMHH